MRCVHVPGPRLSSRMTMANGFLLKTGSKEGALTSRSVVSSRGPNRGRALGSAPRYSLGVVISDRIETFEVEDVSSSARRRCDPCGSARAAGPACIRCWNFQPYTLIIRQ